MGSRSVERIEETLIEARSPKRECIRFLLLLALFGSLPLFATAKSLAQKGAAYPEIKPESKEWCSQLNQAAVRARGLDPGMRSYTLLLASQGLQKCAPKKYGPRS
jgi:hypothetical protein